jgi:hypothetical protein
MGFYLPTAPLSMRIRELAADTARAMCENETDG